MERTIENWLNSANEMGYLMPFSQLLLSEEFSICHTSRQNAFEQGKDVVALDKHGSSHAFQLKGGNITHSRWLKEVKGEIEELIDLAIEHPSVSKGSKHKSYLVTNGELEDTVRVAIDNLNSNKWKENPLEVITYGQLLRGFVALSNTFVPQKVGNYKTFLDLYFSNGGGLIDERIFSDFIADVLRLKEDGLFKEERRRNVAAAVLYTSYILAPFKKENNHIAIIQILTLLGSHIMAVAEKFSLPEKYWEESFKIIQDEIFLTGGRLQEEITNDGLVTLVNSMWDGEIGSYRRHLAVSYLFSFKLAQLFEKNTLWNNAVNDAFFVKLKDSMKLWGEGAIYSLIVCFLYVNRALSKKEDDRAFSPLFTALEAVLKFNSPDSKFGLLSPYYGITFAIKRRYGQLEEPLDEKFTGRSFLIRSLIDLLARHSRRLELEKYWRAITHIAQDKFIPEELWQHFTWHCDKGDNQSEFSNQTQSWIELVKNANAIDFDSIPKTIQTHLSFLPLFLLVYPHRINSNYIKFLDETVKNA